MLLNIAENLPREVQGISALCNPIPPLVRQNEREIHKIILKAREQPLVKVKLLIMYLFFIVMLYVLLRPFMS